MGYRIASNIGIALGNIKLGNDYYLNQLDEANREQSRHFLRDIMGRDIRYIADETQTSLSLAIEASKKVIEENKVDIEEIDMVICISHTPEYVSPTMARMILDALGSGKDTVNCLDMNVNCTGMLVALDMADRYFKTDENLSKILVVQGDSNSNFNIEKGSPFFGCLGDIGCAVILEKDDESGIQSRYFLMDKTMGMNIVYPKDGYSKPNPVLYTDPNLDARVDMGANLIAKKYDKEKIDHMKLICMSQFAYVNCQKYIEMSQIDAEKVPYIGDQYGYTGASSPILALKAGIEQGKLNRGDTFLLWTYGAGTQHVVLEMKY